MLIIEESSACVTFVKVLLDKGAVVSLLFNWLHIEYPWSRKHISTQETLRIGVIHVQLTLNIPYMASTKIKNNAQDQMKY